MPWPPPEPHHLETHPQLRRLKSSASAAVSEGEQAIEKKLGMSTNADETSQHDQNTAPQDAGTGQQGN